MGVAFFLVNFFKKRGVDCGFAGHTCSREVHKGAIGNKGRTGCYPTFNLGPPRPKVPSALPPILSLIFHPRQSRRFRASHDHGAATGCYTAYSD